MGALSLSVTIGSSTAGLASLIMNILLLIAVVVSGEQRQGGGRRAGTARCAPAFREAGGALPGCQAPSAVLPQASEQLHSASPGRQAGARGWQGLRQRVSMTITPTGASAPGRHAGQSRVHAGLDPLDPLAVPLLLCLLLPHDQRDERHQDRLRGGVGCFGG